MDKSNKSKHIQPSPTPIAHVNPNEKSVMQVKPKMYPKDGEKNQSSNTKKKGLLTMEEKKSKMIISKIDNIYNCIKEETSYFTRVKAIIVFYSTVCQIMIWFLFLFTNLPKNKCYCYNMFSNEFQSCDQKTMCNSADFAISTYLFVDDDNISDVNDLIELQNVNRKYKNFFLKDKEIFENFNYNMIDLKERPSEKYQVIIYITTKETFGLTYAYYQTCNRISLLSSFAIITLMSSFFGNVFFCFMADVFGRKRIMLINSILSTISFFVLTILSYVIIVTPNKYETYKSWDYRNIEYLSMNFTNLDKSYLENFNTIVGEINTGIYINKTFKEYLPAFYFFFFISVSSCMSSSIIALAYLLENSVNEDSIFSSYLAFSISIILGFYLVLLITQYIFQIIIIFGLFTFLFLISSVLMLFLEESPRFLFEYGDYEGITNIMRKHVPTELDKLYVDPNKASENGAMIFKKELSIIESNSLSEIYRTIKHQFILYGHFEKRKKIIKEIKEKEFAKITRADIIQNPLVFKIIGFSNSKFRKNFRVIISNVIYVSTSYYIMVNFTNKEFISSRVSVIEDKYIINSFMFWFSLLLIIIYNCVHWIMKFFGISYLLYFGYGLTAIFALLIEFITFFYEPNLDLNKNVGSLTIYTKDNKSILITLTTLAGITVNIIFYVMHFYIIKFTKTLYRCTYLGYFKIYFDVIMIIINAVVLFFDRTTFYTVIACILGFVNSYFMDQETGYTIISDFRKIELNKNED